MSNTDRVTEGAKAAGSFFGSVEQVAGAVKWAIILVVTLIALGIGWKVYDIATNLGGAVIEAGGELMEAGVDGVTETIEAAGENAAAVRESVGTAVGTAVEGIDTEALADTAGNAAEAADSAIDNGLGWLQQRRDQLGAALDGDRDTTVTSVPDPVETE